MRILTSESVNIGHPDKTCDYIADSFLDSALSEDKYSQMAVECAIKDDLLMIYGEQTTKAKVDYEGIVKKVLKDIGYKNDFRVIKQISYQSPEINRAVNGEKLKANDQGIVFGYATNESRDYMPMPISIAHSLMRAYEKFRKTGNLFFADAKSQVSIAYENEKPVKLVTVLMSVSHSESIDNEYIKKAIKENVVDKVLENYDLDKSNYELIVNPSGKFTIWGSFGDSGCVGRKIVVDTYGGVGRVGGGCFSSKNATKVDRSGAYYARYIAKNIVAHNLADRCEVGFSFGIGIEYPLSIEIETFGTNKASESEIYDFVKRNFDLSVDNMIKELDLLKPIFKQTACYGHFGNPDFPWEKIKDCK